MYAGAITEAMPTPIPATSRHAMKSHTANAQPAPSELIVNSAAAATITRTRPSRSAMPPASHAPIAEPTNAHATATPVRDDDSAK